MCTATAPNALCMMVVLFFSSQSLGLQCCIFTFSNAAEQPAAAKPPGITAAPTIAIAPLHQPVKFEDDNCFPSPDQSPPKIGPGFHKVSFLSLAAGDGIFTSLVTV